MNDLTQIIKAGTFLMICHGAYSDREVNDPVRVLRDFVKAEVAEEFKKQWTPETEWDDHPKPEEFLPWLVKAGYVAAVDCVTRWRVGAYGEFEP